MGNEIECMITIIRVDKGVSKLHIYKFVKKWWFHEENVQIEYVIEVVNKLYEFAKNIGNFLQIAMPY